MYGLYRNLSREMLYRFYYVLFDFSIETIVFEVLIYGLTINSLPPSHFFSLVLIVVGATLLACFALEPGAVVLC
jgi:hypothetical protein